MTQPAGESTVVRLGRVGTHLCALPLELVSETMRPLPVVPLSIEPAIGTFLAGVRASAS